MNPKKKIAVYGGAFSPPHLGHASVIEAVLRLFSCDEIWVMPSADRHDKKVSASAEHRFKMLNLMLSELFPNPKIPILISNIEIKRNKATTTFETKMELESKFPDREFYFVVGSDLLGDIKTKWINGEELFNNTNFIAVKKPNVSPPLNLPPHFTWLDDIDWVDVSSTFIRKLLSEGFSGIPYLSPKISDYIKKYKLYLTL